MPINFEQLRRARSWGPHGLACSALLLCLPGAVALAQRPVEAVPPPVPAEILKSAPPDTKGAPASSGAQLETHPSPAAAANAQRAAREPDARSGAEPQESGDAVRAPVARPKSVTPPPRSSPAPAP